MKIVVLDGYSLNPGDLSWNKIAEYGQLEVHDRSDKDDVKGFIKDAQIVFTNKTPISDDDLEGSSVRFISVLATGYNIVDMKAARKRSIPVSNVPVYGTRTVAQYATAMMLELAHQIGRHSESVHQGQWIKNPDFTYQLSPQIELVGKTLGIYGMGAIGQAFAEIARALGMEVIYSSRSKKDLDFEHVGLEELFKRSDFLSLHSPLTPETEGIVSLKMLKLMKPTAMIINTSRGPLIVEEDLVYALKNNLIAGAAIDVVDVEPMKKDSPYLGVKNLIITPHMAWSTKEARQRIMDTSLENLQAFLKGEPINEV